MKSKTTSPERQAFVPTDLLDDEDLGRVLDVTPQYIRCARMEKPTWDGPPWIEISPRVKRYLWADVLKWLEERRKHPSKRRNAA
jgi:hypothetical protein